MIGVGVTSLMATILCNVCEATCPNDSPLMMTKPLRASRIASVKRNIMRRVKVIQ